MTGLLGAVRLRDPVRADVVVFDAVGSDLLGRKVLDGLPYAVLHARRERFDLGPRVLLRMARNALRMWRAGDSRGWGRSALLLRVYLLSWVEHVRPKVVLTWVDNHRAYHWLSRAYTACPFYAIQNGVRYRYDMTEWLPEVPGLGKIVSMPDLVCFGRYEEDLYRRFGHDVDRFHPVGSLQAGWYRSEISPQPPAPTHDLCLVSQWEPPGESGFPEIARGVAQLDAFLARYVAERGATLSVASRTADPREADHMRAAYGDAVDVVPADRAAMATYRAMDAARAVVTFCSTAGTEAFGWGACVLFCNLSGDDNYDMPVEGAWSLVGCDYETFRDRLDAMVANGDGDVADAADAARRYVMAYDPALPAHRYVRGLVDTALRAADPS